jgi:hypothetical protein
MRWEFVIALILAIGFFLTVRNAVIERSVGKIEGARNMIGQDHGNK